MLTRCTQCLSTLRPSFMRQVKSQTYKKSLFYSSLNNSNNNEHWSSAILHFDDPPPPIPEKKISKNKVSSNDAANNDNNNNNSDSNIESNNSDSSSSSKFTFPKRVPNNFWKDLSNQRRFFDHLAKELNVNRVDEWLTAVPRTVVLSKTRGLIQQLYDNSLERALRTIYPEHRWQSPEEATTTTTITRRRRGFWMDESNARQFLDNLALELNIKSPEDWYDVTPAELKKRGGASLLRIYGSLANALRTLYPETAAGEVVCRKSRSKASPNFWKDQANRRAFFDRLGQELGIKQLDDWYGVTTAAVHARGGGGLLTEYYGSSLAAALQSVYPEHPWQPGRFIRSPRSYWRDPSTHRKFFDHLAQQFNITHLDDWYKISHEDVIAKGGGGLLNQYYQDSLSLALQSLYPEHPWQKWRFPSRHLCAALTDEELQQYIDAVAKKFQVKHLDDWYRVSETRLRQMGGHRHLRNAGGLFLVLKRLYPNHPWDQNRFITNRNSKKASQRWLKVILHSLFPGVEIIEEYLHPDLAFSNSTLSMELDLYIPSLSLAFEYHGEQHYRDLHFFGSQSSFKQQDDEKAHACKRAGVTLIGVPYWWDRTAESLAATINMLRPDLLANTTASAPSSVLPIPAFPPTPTNQQYKQRQQQQQ